MVKTAKQLSEILYSCYHKILYLHLCPTPPSGTLVAMIISCIGEFSFFLQKVDSLLTVHSFSFIIEI